MPEFSHPIRILHVVERMNRGGIEVWLMHILRAIDKDHFHIDFLVHSLEPGEFDQEIYGLGAKIWRCPHVGNPLLYAKDFRQILRNNGPYDIIHSHVHHFSGLLLFLACTFGIPIRIAHSHCDSALVDAGASYTRKMYLWFMKQLIDQYATIGLAVSEKAAKAIRNGVSSRVKWKIIPCGIDLLPFSVRNDKALLRKEWGIPDQATVIGHVGNFVLPKNHEFIVQVACEFIKLKPNSYLVLIGDGELKDTIKNQVKTLHIDEHICFLGTRQDVPRLLNMMDVFLFPSVFEGLGLAVIEAQAAGLPIVISDAVPKEVDIVPGLLQWLSLSQSPAAWAEACVQAQQDRPNISQMDACTIVSRTSLNILNNVQELQNIYAGN